jgi:DNA-binding NarL/FixJ family response regulator
MCSGPADWRCRRPRHRVPPVGRGALRRRVQQVSSPPVVVIGSEASDAELVELIEAGCCGCVRRDAALVSSRIRDLSRDLTGTLETPALTAREAEVLRLAARGLSNKDIATQLRIWSQTVKSHLHNVYNRLGVRTRRAAVAKALRLGLIREP